MFSGKRERDIASGMNFDRDKIIKLVLQKEKNVTKHFIVSKLGENREHKTKSEQLRLLKSILHIKELLFEILCYFCASKHLILNV